MKDKTDTGITLAKALRAGRGDVVSFVGGGGKTTSMFRLASELCADGLRVVTTTTTHITEEQVHLSPVSIPVDDLDSLTPTLDRHGQCLLIGAPDGKGRVHGASPESIAGLIARPDIDAVLVEADGSRSLPFKAPGAHEPVVPGCTTILVPIAGLNTLGQPLDEDHVHRSEIAAALAQAPAGSPITAETVARVLAHPQGGAKQRPAGARLVPLLNRADSDDAFRQAGDLAEKLLAFSGVDGVIINSMQQNPSVLEAWVPTAGIILATAPAAQPGADERDLSHEDIALLGSAARAALDAGLDPVIVVLGYEAEKVEHALAGLSVERILNPEAAKGQGSSIRKGLSVLPSRTGAVVFFSAGRPSVTAGTIESLVRAHRRTLAPACMPALEEKHEFPALFDKSLFDELANLGAENGIQKVLDRYTNLVIQIKD